MPQGPTGPGSTTPANGTTVHVAASDLDGDLLSYAWSQVSGPGAASFFSCSAADGGVAFSTTGTYVLRGTVTDGRGGAATSDVTIGVTVMNGNDPELRITGFGRHSGAPGEFILRWQSASNRWYTVQAATNLLNGFNLNLRTSIQATPPENVHTDDVSGAGCKFYRIRVE